jgi:hypothetical protein
VKQGDFCSTRTGHGGSASLYSAGTADGDQPQNRGENHAGRVPRREVNAFTFAGEERLPPAGILHGNEDRRMEKLPCVMHDYIEGRPIIFETTFDQYTKDHSAGIHQHHFPGAAHENGHENGNGNDDSRGDLRFFTGGVSDSMGRGDNDEKSGPAEPPSLWPEYKYDGYRWGMAIICHVQVSACVRRRKTIFPVGAIRCSVVECTGFGLTAIIR